MKKLSLFFIISFLPLEAMDSLDESNKGMLGSLAHTFGKLTDYDGFLKNPETTKIYIRTTQAIAKKTTKELFDDKQFCKDSQRILKRSFDVNTRLEQAMKNQNTDLVILLLRCHRKVLIFFMSERAMKYLQENAQERTQELKELKKLMQSLNSEIKTPENSPEQRQRKLSSSGTFGQGGMKFPEDTDDEKD